MTTDQLPRQSRLRQRHGYTLLLGGLTLWVLAGALLTAALPVLSR